MAREGTGGLDETDRRLLAMLQRDCRVPLQEVAEILGVPKSTVHYRIRKLEQDGIVEGYHAKVNATRLGYDYLAVVLVRARYGPKYHEKVGRRLAKVPGVSAVYYVLGDIDFIVLIRARDRDDYMQKLSQLSSMTDIERTSTQIVAKVMKEDPRVNLSRNSQ
ncbi:MAG TPA: Lrp/AsnC family transcriptional regulator [Candidatus Dormibacteraeota bacterium]|nr:Lrp/AsnC family transcriptional regulator [Candidatus Dormibacteraeota bacterium]